MKVLAATGLAAAAAQERPEGQLGFGQLGWVVVALLEAHWLKYFPYLCIYMKMQSYAYAVVGVKKDLDAVWVGFIRGLGKEINRWGKDVENSRKPFLTKPNTVLYDIYIYIY